MGIQHTVMRAAIANMCEAAKRGIFNTIYGASWFAGSTLMGI
jgi:hypothetical protein